MRWKLESLGQFRLGYNDLCGDDILALTKSQVNGMTKAYNNKAGLTIKMSKAQLRCNMKIEGGFPGALMGIASKVLPFLGKTLLPGLIGGIGQATGNIVTNKIAGNGLYLKKGSNIARVETGGQGLYLNVAKALDSAELEAAYIWNKGVKYLTVLDYFWVRTAPSNTSPCSAVACKWNVYKSFIHKIKDVQYI